MSAARASRFVRTGAPRGIGVSFEFFPPKTAEMEQSLWEAIGRLAPLKPNFVSVTYGAGGSTRERTHATVKRILAETMLTPAAHLTCVAATRAEIDAVIAAYAQAGVRHIVALRGDPPGGAGERYAPHPGGYRNAADLVAGIKRIARLRSIGLGLSGKTSGQPVGRRRHRHAQGQGRRRRDARDHPVLFRERAFISAISTACAPAASTIPIVPGILPVQNFKQPRRISPRAAAPRCRTGSPSASTASTTIRRRAS